MPDIADRLTRGLIQHKKVRTGDKDFPPVCCRAWTYRTADMGMGGAGLGRQSGFSAKRAVRTRNLQKYLRNVEKCCAPATSLHESSSWAGGPPPWYAWCAEKAGQEGTGEAKNPRGVRTVSTGVDATSAEASVPEAGSLWREKS